MIKREIEICGKRFLFVLLRRFHDYTGQNSKEIFLKIEIKLNINF